MLYFWEKTFSLMEIEICVASLTSIKNAADAGADRVELCAALEVGGLTPSFGLIQAAVALNLLPIHCLIRPRSGNFSYTDSELEIFQADVLQAKQLGCAAAVVGVLNAHFEVDVKAMKTILEIASPMKVVFHRAFDVIPNPFIALEQLIDLGVDTILTSGQKETAFEGRSCLVELQERSQGRITIMPGSGVNASNCEWYKNQNFKAIHLSGAKALPQLPIPVGVNAEISFLSQIQKESDVEQIKRVVEIIKG